MPLTIPNPFPRALPAAGQYLLTTSPAAAATNGALGNSTLRVAPWVVTRTIAIDRIGADIATVGEAGSKLRIGIFADTGNCYPGAVLLDAGQIAGDSATTQDLTVSLTLGPGLYWIGGAVQSAATTQPTVRVTSNWQPLVPISVGSSAPTAGTTMVGYSQSSVTGALGTFSGTVANISAAPRIHVRLA